MIMINTTKQTTMKAEAVKRERTLGLKQEKETSAFDLPLNDLHTGFLMGTNGSCVREDVFVDAGWKPNLNAAAGWIRCKDSLIIDHKSCCFKSESAIQAEAFGIKEALLWAKGMKILHLTVSTDCLQLIQQITGRAQRNHQTSSIIEDISDLASFFHCLCIMFVPRSRNTKAHSLAKAALRE
ncbi:hypothetical protein vseg_017683 [Gypsophila vaccaria]